MIKLLERVYLVGSGQVGLSDPGDCHVYLIDGGQELGLDRVGNAVVLAAANRVATEAIGLAEEVGTLTPGKRADLVAFEGNPLDDLRALRRIDRVFRDGRLAAADGVVTLL